VSNVYWEDRGWASIVQHVRTLGTLVLEAGIVGSDANDPHGDSGLTNGEIGALLEFGTQDGHIPARHWLRGALRQQDFLVRWLAEAARSVVAGSSSPESALALVGQRLVHTIKDNISNGIEPGNADATIRKKGFNYPLVDTGELVRHISSLVRKHGAALGDAGEYDDFEIGGGE
jgi:hypothetical protein